MVHNCGRNLRFLLLIMLYGQDMWIQIHWKICSSHSQEGAWSPLTHCGQVMPYGNIDESTLAQVMVCCLRATDQYRTNIDHWIWWYLVMSHDISYTSNCPRPTHFIINKANLRDLIAVTGLVIFLNLNSNRPFFIRCDLEIWWMTSKNYRAPLLHYIQLCASSHTPRWFQTGATVRKCSIRVKIGDFCPVWPWNLIDDIEKQ